MLGPSIPAEKTGMKKGFLFNLLKKKKNKRIKFWNLFLKASCKHLIPSSCEKSLLVWNFFYFKVLPCVTKLGVKLSNSQKEL